MDAGQLDRRIRFLRGQKVDDGFANIDQWQDHGTPVWASRRDVSDAEKAGEGTVYAEVSARFRVRSSSFTRGILPTDRLVESGQVFEIIGIKQLGRRDFLEITGVAKVTG